MRIPIVLTNSILYSFSSILQKGILFLLLPIYTRYLSPDDFGTLVIISTISGFLSQIFLMSIHSAASRFHFCSTDDGYKKKLWGTCFLFVLVNSIFVTSIVVLFNEYFIVPFIKGIRFYPLMFISILTALFNAVYLFYLHWLRTLQKGKLYSINVISNFFIIVFLNLVGLIFFNLGILSPILSSFIVSIIYFIFSVFCFIRYSCFNFDFCVIKKTIKYAFPLIPHSISGYWSSSIDRIILNSYMNTHAVGLYSVASQFSVIISEISSGINKAFSPWFFERISNNKGNFYPVYIFAELSVILVSLLAMIISLFSPEIISIMTSSNFSNAWIPIVFLCYGKVAQCLYFFFSQPLFYFSPKLVFIVSLTSLMTNILLNVILIPLFGIVGTGLSFYFSYMILSILALYLSLIKAPQIRFRYNRMFFISIIFLLLSLSVFVFQSYFSTILVRIAYKLVFVLVVCLIVVFFYKNKIEIVSNQLNHFRK